MCQDPGARRSSWPTPLQAAALSVSANPAVTAGSGALGCWTAAAWFGPLLPLLALPPVVLLLLVG
jgi:hypothetical protein